MKLRYSTKEMFLRGLLAFGRMFSGSNEPLIKSFKRPPSNPAGSRLLRRWYKAATGQRGSYKEALEYWGNRQ